MKQLTTNEMIYKTLTTKMTKEPKYKSVLADLGIEVYNSDWSSENLWSVRYPATNRTLVISKGYDNKRRIYDCYKKIGIKRENIKLMDYLGYLKCDRTTDVYPKPSEYCILKEKIRYAKFWGKISIERVSEIDEEIQKLEQRIQELEQRKGKYLEDCNKYLTDLDTVRDRVRELKKNKGNKA